jgi:hypothetical protein
VNKKNYRKQQKAIRRRHAQKLFEAPVIENVVSVASATTPDLSREQRRLLDQIDNLAADIMKLFHAASLKLMLEGLRESRTETTK